MGGTHGHSITAPCSYSAPREHMLMKFVQIIVTQAAIVCARPFFASRMSSYGLEEIALWIRISHIVVKVTKWKAFSTYLRANSTWTFGLGRIFLFSMTAALGRTGDTIMDSRISVWLASQHYRINSANLEGDLGYVKQTLQPVCHQFNHHWVPAEQENTKLDTIYVLKDASGLEANVIGWLEENIEKALRWQQDLF